jgi:hypothetical protein
MFTQSKILLIALIFSLFSSSPVTAQEAFEEAEKLEEATDVEEVAEAGEEEADEEKKGFMAQMKDPEDGKFDISQYLLDNIVGFLPVPIIITEPAVDNGLGFVGAFFHQPKADQMQPGDEHMILPNISAVAIAYTGNDSKIIGGGHFRNWGKDHYRYEVMAGYADINLDWYGGEDTPDPEDGIRFNAKGGMLDQEFLMRLGESRWYMGPELRIMSSEVSFDLGLPIELPPVENNIVGLGLIALYENVDYKISPRSGFQTELKAVVNDETIGSDYDFRQFSWQVRQYFEFADKYTLAWRLDGSTTSGDIPFYMEPFVDLKGIAAMRYQGPTAATVEVRGGVDITPRWSVLAFAGAGRTADSISDLSSADSNSAYGAGFRYLIARRLGMRVGIDIAKGPEETFAYLIVGSAW